MPFKFHRSHLVSALVSVVAVAWIASGQLQSAEVPAQDKTTETKDARLPHVEVVASRSGNQSNILELFGRTEAEKTVEISAEIESRVAERPVDKGSFVRKGDVILRLATEDRKARYEEAKAALEMARVTHDAASRLAQKNFRSPVSLAEAKAELEAAKAAVAAAELELSHTTIRAPSDGILDAIPVEIGEVVSPGTVLARLIDLNPTLVVGHIAEKDRTAVSVGDTANVHLVTGPTLTGRVRYIARVADPQTRSFRVEVEIPNDDGRISEGLTADLGIMVGTIQAHRIPRAALTLSDEGQIGVKIVADDGTIRFLSGEFLREDGSDVLVAGLPESMNLVVDGQETVLDGQPVKASTSVARLSADNAF